MELSRLARPPVLVLHRIAPIILNYKGKVLALPSEVTLQKYISPTLQASDLSISTPTLLP